MLEVYYINELHVCLKIMRIIARNVKHTNTGFKSFHITFVKKNKLLVNVYFLVYEISPNVIFHLLFNVRGYADLIEIYFIQTI